jgi:hypothetical protein
LAPDAVAAAKRTQEAMNGSALEPLSVVLTALLARAHCARKLLKAATRGQTLTAFRTEQARTSSMLSHTVGSGDPQIEV